jgi:hypothetical protein
MEVKSIIRDIAVVICAKIILFYAGSYFWVSIATNRRLIGFCYFDHAWKPIHLVSNKKLYLPDYTNISL